MDNHAQSGIHFTACQFCMQMNSTHACTSAYTHTHTHAHTNDNTHACINAYILAHSQIHRHTTHTHTHMYTHAHTHAHTHACTHTHLSPTCSLQSRAVPLCSSARRCLGPWCILKWCSEPVGGGAEGDEGTSEEVELN